MSHSFAVATAPPKSTPLPGVSAMHVSGESDSEDETDFISGISAGNTVSVV